MSKLPDISSNLKCWRKLNKLVFGDSVSCPQCTASLHQNYQSRYLWCSACRRKYRPTAHKGSWLYGMKLSPRQLFMLLWAWQNRKSPDTACLLAGVSYTSVRRWYSHFRCNLPEPDTVLEGIVQVDESFFGKQKSQQSQVIVVGAIEPTERKIVLRATNSRTKEVLEQFVDDAIAPGSLVVSDKWYGYQDLPFLGYGHESHNHSIGQFGATNQIEGLWSCIKRYLRKLYGCVPTRHIGLILKEWTARQNQPSWFTSPENYLRVALFRVS